jgi:hypothetical protein
VNVATQEIGDARAMQRTALVSVGAAIFLVAVKLVTGIVTGSLAFVAEALQPVAAESIRDEGERYFGFLVLGLATATFIGVALRGVDGFVSSGNSSNVVHPKRRPLEKPMGCNSVSPRVRRPGF